LFEQLYSERYSEILPGIFQIGDDEDLSDIKSYEELVYQVDGYRYYGPAVNEAILGDEIDANRDDDERETDKAGYGEDTEENQNDFDYEVNQNIYETRDHDNYIDRWLPLEKIVYVNLNKPLRQWQERALSEWERRNHVGILEAVTGSGKSLVGILAAAKAIDEGFAVVIVVPSVVLQEQWISELQNLMYRTDGSRKVSRIVGGLGGEYALRSGKQRTLPATGKIVVAVDATFSKHLDLHPTRDCRTLIIADEVHGYSGKKRKLVLNDEFERRLGLTAMLLPPEGRMSVFNHYFKEPIIFTYGHKLAIRDRVISQYRVLLIRVKLQGSILEEYHESFKISQEAKAQLCLRSGVDFNFENENEILGSLKDQKLFEAEIEAWERSADRIDQILSKDRTKVGVVGILTPFISRRGNTIFFTDTVKWAREISRILDGNGVKSGIIKSGVTDKERKRIFSDLRSGDIKALISPKALDQGINLEELLVGMFVGTSRNRLQIIQRLGRVLRIDEGKKTPLIVFPVNVDTWEDPKVDGNEKLQFSPIGFILENAFEVQVFNASETSLIQEFVSGLI